MVEEQERTQAERTQRLTRRLTQAEQAEQAERTQRTQRTQRMDKPQMTARDNEQEQERQAGLYATTLIDMKDLRLEHGRLVVLDDDSFRF